MRTREELDDLPRRRLGEILINEGMTTQVEIDQALARKKERGGFLGQILVEAGYITEDALISVLVKQCRIPHIGLADYEIDKQIVDLVPFEVCKEHRILPIDKLGSILTIAMVDPLDLEALQKISQLTSMRIKPLLCSWSDFDEVFSRLFRDQLSKGIESKVTESFPFELDKLRKREEQAAAVAGSEQDDVVVLAESPTSVSAARAVEVVTGAVTLAAELESGGLPPVSSDPELAEALVKLRRQPEHSPIEVASAGSNIERRDLNPALTFETFVPSPANTFAVAVCRAVAESPGPRYNPLYVYGATGVGKSHLLSAIGNVVKRNFPDRQVCYLPALEFSEQLLESIQSHELKSFREDYSRAFVFIIDDIQHLMGRDRVQEEFYNIFNELYARQRQIIVSADRAPEALVGLEKGLRSRFHSGIITGLESPDLETRLAILESKTDEWTEQIPHEVLLFVASQVPQDVRKLEGAMKKLVAYASLVRQQVTVALAKEILKHLFEAEVAT